MKNIAERWKQRINGILSLSHKLMMVSPEVMCIMFPIVKLVGDILVLGLNSSLQTKISHKISSIPFEKKSGERKVLALFHLNDWEIK